VPVDMDGRVDAFDRCEPMIARAGVELADLSVEFNLGDTENMQMPDGANDAEVCRHPVWAFVDLAAALADWFRAQKPGGRLVGADRERGTTTKARVKRTLSA
jgi:ubiquinone/menaquinone biosynthesis C-methylase UbiE